MDDAPRDAFTQTWTVLIELGGREWAAGGRRGRWGRGGEDFGLSRTILHEIFLAEVEKRPHWPESNWPKSNWPKQNGPNSNKHAGLS